MQAWVIVGRVALVALAACGAPAEPARSGAATRSAHTAEKAPTNAPVAQPVPVSAPAPEAASTPTDRPPPPEPWPVVESLVAQAIAAGDLPGAVIGVGSRQGLHYLKAFGDRSVEPTREAMRIDTVFDLASLTKPLLTATAVMQLADRGALSLDAPVRRYLPEYRRPATRNIRVRHLLLHTAGLPKVSPLGDFELPKATAERRLLQLDPELPVGRRFRYGDTHYLVLGILVERVSGLSLAAYGKAHIATPLGLERTFFGQVPTALRARTAPTELREEAWIRGDTHDPRAYRLGGVAGNAGMFSTARDLSRIAQALLRGGRADTGRLLSAQAVANMTRPRAAGQAVRAYGWDVLSDYSRLRGERLSAQAYGHGGFTGSSLWIDPGRDLFVIFLSHRVHPDGGGRVLELVGAVTDAVVARQDHPTAPSWPATGTGPSRPDPKRGHTRPGIDVALGNHSWADALAPSEGGEPPRIAAVVNRASVTRDGKRTLDVLANHDSVRLVRLFTPEHGLFADAEGHVADAVEPRTGLPVVSLFGRHRRPGPQAVSGLDAILFDLQDVGARFYTYMSTLNELLATAARHDLPLVVLDRPNPLGANLVEGPVQDPNVRSFVHYHPLPVRHGMTAGELAGLLNAQRRKPAPLRVVWMEGYCRELPYEETGLTWVPPSPNLPNLTSVRLYPAVALLEGSNVSVARGTGAPFQQVGAPWLAPDRWLGELDPGLGVGFFTTRFTPTSGPFRGREIPGVGLDATRLPRSTLDLGLHLIATLHRTHPEFELERVHRMLGHRESLTQVESDEHPLRPTASHILRLASFLEVRQKHLHYPRCASPPPRPE